MENRFEGGKSGYGEFRKFLQQFFAKDNEWHLELGWWQGRGDGLENEFGDKIVKAYSD